MTEPSPYVVALGRATRRVVYHLLHAAIEGLKAVEAVIEEMGSIGDARDENGGESRRRIEIE